MTRFMIAVAGLAWVAGCAGEPPMSAEPMPLPGEAFADPEDPPVKACLTVVSLNTGTAGVVPTGIATGPEGSSVTVDAAGTRYRCTIDAAGRVTAMVPLSGR